MLGSRVSLGLLGKAACVTITLVIIAVACDSSGNNSADAYVPTATSSDELVAMMRYMGMGMTMNRMTRPRASQTPQR